MNLKLAILFLLCFAEYGYFGLFLNQFHNTEENILGELLANYSITILQPAQFQALLAAISDPS
jgi:hypothetical protein